MIDFLLSVNIKPIIQLSFMPQQLAKNPTRYATNSKFIISLPKSIDHWCTLVTQFLRHCAARYSIETIRTWIYTLWNEPDISLKLFGLPVQEFMPFYKAIYQTVKGYDAGLVFASPSFL